MAMINGLKTQTRYYARLARIFLSYKRKRARVRHLPVRLWIEPTSYCNLRCIMCPNKDLEARQKGYMEFDLYRKIIAQASRFVFDIHLLHRGESLLHPDFFRMIRHAHEAGIVTRFHTNGTLLDEDKAHRLIASGLDQFAFSFDGFDRETYEKIRVNADFEKTVDNIIRFLKIKERLKARKPETLIELINFPHLYENQGRDKLKEFISRFRRLPLDRIVIKEMHNWAGETGACQPQRKYAPCTFLWHALIIFWDGSVLPCTQDFHGYYILGNVRDSSLAEIWNNERMVNLRRRISHGDIAGLETCSVCDRVRRKHVLGIPKEYLGRFLLKKMD